MFLRVRKKYWLLPIFFVTIMFGALVVLSEGSVVAAFTYPSGEWRLFSTAPSPLTCPDHRQAVRVDVAKFAIPECLYG